MAFTKYRTIKFRAATLDTIEQANDILEEYAGQGLVLTLRQLYYQFVARDLLPANTQQQYNRTSLGTEARVGNEQRKEIGG